MNTGDEKAFEKIAPLIKKRGVAPVLPPFDPTWLTQDPTYRVSPEVFDLAGIAGRMRDESPTDLSEEGEGKKVVSISSYAFMRKGGLAAAAAVLVLIPVIYFAFLQGSGDPVGVPVQGLVLTVRGSLTRIASSSSPGQAGAEKKSERIFAGRRVDEEDTLVTGDDSLADIALSDRSILRLRANSALRLDSLRKLKEGESQTRLSLKRGDMLNYVNKSRRGDEYRVTTPTSIASVRGTSFGVKSSKDGGSEVLVSEGMVAVKSLTGNDSEMIAEKGDLIKIPPPAKKAAPGKIQDQNAAAEREREYEELKNLLAELGPGVVQRLEKAKNIKTEDDLQKHFGANLEIVELKDGRKLRGVTAAMKGDRLVFHTMNSVEIVNTSDIERVVIIKQLQAE